MKLPSTAITVAHAVRQLGHDAELRHLPHQGRSDGVDARLGQHGELAGSSTQGGAQNTGVAQIVQKTDGAIGYVDYSDAQAIGLTYAKVKNADGKYIAPSTKARVARGRRTRRSTRTSPTTRSTRRARRCTRSRRRRTSSRTSNQTDANKGNALKGFLNYIYGAGQVTAPTVDYAPLSKDLLTQAKAQVSKIVVPAA